MCVCVCGVRLVFRVCGKSCNTCTKPYWSSYNAKLAFDRPEACCKMGDKACTKEYDWVVKTRNFEIFSGLKGIVKLAESETAAF